MLPKVPKSWKCIAFCAFPSVMNSYPIANTIIEIRSYSLAFCHLHAFFQLHVAYLGTIEKSLKIKWSDYIEMFTFIHCHFKWDPFIFLLVHSIIFNFYVFLNKILNIREMGKEKRSTCNIHVGSRQDGLILIMQYIAFGLISYYQPVLTDGA